MKLTLLSVTLCSVVFCIPHDVQLDDLGGCGKETVKRFKLIRTQNAKMNLACELCLDMVLLAEQYVTCGEAILENLLEQKCDKDFTSPFLDKVCRDIVQKLAHEAIEDTQRDPTKLCYKILHMKCTYKSI